VRTSDFLPALEAAFDDFPRSELPRDERFAEIHGEVENLATPNTLALLSVAASLLGDGESYVEVGSYRGASLAAALTGNGARGVGIDRFGFRGSTRADLESTLDRLGVAERTEIVEGDAFQLLADGALEGTRTGVYYYDAAHDYDSQLKGLRLIEPYLAEDALVIVDDSDWEDVDRATRAYLATQPRAKTLLVVEGSSRGMPWWWEGMHVIEWHA
jgi:predicted O-methyltransferase YrrM